MLTDKQKEWAGSVLARMIEKESAVIRRSGEKIPYTTVDGVFADKYAEDPAWWTNCFWHGILWRVYLENKDQDIRALAQRLEQRMDPVLHNYDQVHHDAGFMWLHASVADWRITNNWESRNRGLLAAEHLASRFNPQAGFITAWNGKDREGWSIIDSMMNLPLLYWASKETGYGRFAEIARCHADKTMACMIRPDGSAVHIIEYGLEDGSVIQTFGGQGYAVGSSWSRGQAWAIYGFVLSWLHTGERCYLDTAKQVAHYFLAACAACRYIPPIDFRAPTEPLYIDTTAGAIAACGLIELANALSDSYESGLYLNGACNLLEALEREHADFTDTSDALLHNGSEAYPPRPVHMDIIYGDYFFLEAFCKLSGDQTNLW